MKVLAVTGGIGSGKSYVMRIFSALGYPIYYADTRAKSLYDLDQSLRSDLISLLGDSIYKGGVLQKRVMAELIFNNRDLLERVEQLVFPAIMRDFSLWKRNSERFGSKFVLFESAIFLEKPILRPLADKILTVSASEELRIERVIKRDNFTIEEVRARMKNQMTDGEREKLADFVIYSEERDAVLPQILKIIEIMNNSEN